MLPPFPNPACSLTDRHGGKLKRIKSSNFAIICSTFLVPAKSYSTPDSLNESESQLVLGNSMNSFLHLCASSALICHTYLIPKMANRKCFLLSNGFTPEPLLSSMWPGQTWIWLFLISYWLLTVIKDKKKKMSSSDLLL